MGTLLVILVFTSALVALVAATSALRAGLKLRRTRAVLSSHLSSKVAQLARRSTELEKNLAALDARVQAMPVRISELQQNLATLRLLTSTLSTSLRQAQRVLSLTGLKSSLARPLAGAFGTQTKSNEGSVARGQREDTPRP
ncbi:MAG TPA: hypothetical protein VK361_01990 [Rubrobacteraceae bacterium]|nr:hypothetical protein [Rubrobacteraceae bacterium]